MKINKRKFRVYVRKNREMILVITFLVFFLLTLGIIGGVEMRDCLKGGICL